MEAVDAAAMRAGLFNSDDYLAHWRRGEPSPCGDDLDQAVADAVASLDAAYDTDRLRRLIEAGGVEGVMPDRLVVFTPSGKRGHFPEGTTLLEAARKLGADLNSVCGGRGICGRCQVEIAEGQFAKHGIESRADSVTPWNRVEQRYADIRGALKAGRRLGCQAQLLGDVVVDIPAESQVHRQVVRKAADSRPIALDPVVTLHYVEVAEPDMHDPASDFRRLADALRREWGIADARAGNAVLATLQKTLRAGQWKVTAAVRHGRDIVGVWPGLVDRIYGVAVDIGSTTVAAHLSDLTTGETLASAGVMNPQIRFGEDLMSRVSYAMLNPGGDREMTAAIREAVAALVARSRGRGGDRSRPHRRDDGGRQPDHAPPLSRLRPGGARRRALRADRRPGARYARPRPRPRHRAGRLSSTPCR